MVWLVLSGPVAVVLAGTLTAFIAWSGSDPEVERAEAVRERVLAKDPLAPALRARNHAGSPSAARP